MYYFGLVISFLMIVELQHIQAHTAQQQQQQQQQKSIMGGDTFESGALPWLISIGTMANIPSTREEREKMPSDVKIATHLCTGIMINPIIVLTVSSCVDHVAAVGVSHSSQGDLTAIYEKGRVPVRQIIMQPPLALLLLPKPIAGSPKTAAPLFLSSSAALEQQHPPLSTTIGWTSGHRLHLVPLQSIPSSQTQWLTTMAPTKDMAPCQRDLGSPLIVDTSTGPQVLGLAASPGGIPNITPKDKWCTGQSAFLDLRPFHGWITANTPAFIKDEA